MNTLNTLVLVTLMVGLLIYSADGCEEFFSGGTVMSPNYPDFYPNDANECWTFIAAPGQIIEVNFDVIDMESGYDYLYVYESASTLDAPAETYTGFSMGEILVFSNNILTIHLVSDDSYPSYGFSAFICFIDDISEAGGCVVPIPTFDTGLEIGSNGCYEITEEMEWTTINYPSNYNREALDCWTITAPIGYQVELYFRDLEVDAYYDYIYLIDGDTPTIASSFNDITGALSDIEPNIFAPSNVLTLVFESDTFGEFRGGAADVYFINSADIITCEELGPGIYTTPGYDTDGYYPDDTRICWAFIVPPPFYVHIEFLDFELQDTQDQLTIFDGGLREDVLAAHTGATLPPAVTSPTFGSPMTVLMESDGSTHLRGARWEVKTMCDLRPEGDYTTPGYGVGGYPSSANLCMSFLAPVGRIVRISFTSFDFESGYDYFSVFDGEMTGTELLRQDGTTNPDPIESTGRMLTVHISSDGGTQGNGVAAVIEFLVAPGATIIIQSTLPPMEATTDEGTGSDSSNTPAYNTDTGHTALLMVSTSNSHMGESSTAHSSEYSSTESSTVPLVVADSDGDSNVVLIALCCGLGALIVGAIGAGIVARKCYTSNHKNKVKSITIAPAGSAPSSTAHA